MESSRFFPRGAKRLRRKSNPALHEILRITGILKTVNEGVVGAGGEGPVREIAQHGRKDHTARLVKCQDNLCKIFR